MNSGIPDYNPELLDNYNDLIESVLEKWNSCYYLPFVLSLTDYVPAVIDNYFIIEFSSEFERFTNPSSPDRPFLALVYPAGKIEPDPINPNITRQRMYNNNNFYVWAEPPFSYQKYAQRIYINVSSTFYLYNNDTCEWNDGNADIASPKSFSFKKALTHEIGHILGLGHIHSNNNFMSSLMENIPNFDQNFSTSDELYIQKILAPGTGDNEDIINSNISITTYPNPCKTSVSIVLSDYKSNHNYDIKIFNIKGQLIKKIENINPNKSIIWDLNNNNNQKVPSGIYYYQIRDNNKIILTKKLIVIK